MEHSIYFKLVWTPAAVTNSEDQNITHTVFYGFYTGDMIR